MSPLLLAAACVGAPVSAWAVAVTGEVRDTRGAPVASALVTFTSEADPSQAFADVTDESGMYRLDVGLLRPTAIIEASGSPSPPTFHLSQNYPNPFNPSTVIPYELSEGTHVRLVIYSVVGQPVRTLVNEAQRVGYHQVYWDGRDDHGRGVAAGVFIVRMETERFAQSRKLVMLDGAAGASRVSSTGIPAGKPAQAPPQAGAFTVEISGDDIEHFTQRGVKVWSDTTISFEVQRVDAGGGSSGSPPIAIAGPNLSFSAGSLVYLDGGQSADPDGDPLTFHWAIIDAPDAVLIADPSLEQISFTPVVAGVYSLRLTVSDGLLQGTDDVQIIVTAAENLPPTADAGPDQEVNVGTQVVLDGSRSSDPDDEAASLEFQWSVGATPGSIVVLSDPTTVSLRFTPTEPGKYVFGLSVSDGEATSSLDLVTVVAVQVIDRMDDMILVQEGVFTMGSDEGFPDEQPPHLVTLSSYWIDEFEVNTQQYESCTDAGGCTPAAQSAGCNSGMEDRGDHPINCVTWEQGQSYCGWAQKRLPTEAEWEKAARGSDERRFPWGDAPPSSGLLNYANNVGSTTPMGTYPDGLSFYGLHNMGGNVSEWTADFYDPDYYANSPSMDPLGPDDGSTRVARGASWTVGDFALELLTTSARLRLPLPLFDATIGFRCATDHVADGSKTVLPATTPEILIDNLGRALNNADETLYARLLHESFWFTENDVRGELVFRNGLEAESEIVQGIFDVFTFAFEFTLTDRSIEFGADHPPAFAGDPDGHPDDDWEVFRGRVRMEALLEDGNGFHVDQMMTFKLVADGEDDLWRLVRWHNDPVSEGESWRLLKALFG